MGINSGRSAERSFVHSSILHSSIFGYDGAMTRSTQPRAPKPPPSYDVEAFNVLAYEFPFSDQAASDAKIKRRLQRKKLGRFDPERIALLRRLKDELQVEIGKNTASAYYLGPAGPPYADLRDFDLPRLGDDLAAKYPDVAPDELDAFVRLSVLVNHLL